MTDSDVSALLRLAEQIKQRRRGKYDCVIGVSGGLDSSYVAYIARRVMGLTPLLVHYYHGFGYEGARENLYKLADALDCELQVLSSSGQWDRKYVRAIVSALSKADLYWGICTWCHYILPAATYKVAIDNDIDALLVSSNLYQWVLWVPRRFKFQAMLRAVLAAGPSRLPVTLLHLVAARYYLLRLKLEYYMPPVQNLCSRQPRCPIQQIDVTRYVPWDIDTILRTLREEVGWSPPEHPSLEMRFDCMIEDGFINHTFKRATGLTVHAIIANNLIYDDVRTKEQLAEAVAHYDRTIPERMRQVEEKLTAVD